MFKSLTVTQSLVFLQTLNDRPSYLMNMGSNMCSSYQWFALICWVLII